ncbi:CCA tRNA nucleotidyltransferase [Nitratiruptor sp. YY09-18]|uniref:CCA tRNA nucleotidyltransferase n=1 Tax=Nitratiruptor sp. YY09-18 TaxID=2724901 RepID=UPI001915939E|nr:CCA tRNA nucleotidyltransferase [Nitratiruptor sp. YY09-18]BCD67927.1 tRNA nucleotidyltransferase [Nitratiruptor sp. YY09-18]
MQAKFKHGGYYPQLFSLLPPKLHKDLQILRKFFASYTKRVYIVGGSVRDMLRHFIHGDRVTIVDLDIEVYDIAPKEFDTLMQRLDAKGVGKSFFVYKYKENIDISLPRVESKIGRGHKAFAVDLAKDEQEASMRRDFTMNALMLNIYDGKLLDFWKGVDAIAKKRIVIVNPIKFQEDSLRVLRGMQFAARFGYKIEQKSCEIMQKMDLDDLSSERIFWEFEKMFQAFYLHFGLYYLIALRVDRKIFGKEFAPIFFKTAKELQKNRSNFEADLYKFYFLYILAKNAHMRFTSLLDTLKTPNEYYKAFRKQKSLPKNRSDRFLAAMALRMPLKEYLGNYAKDVKIRAQKFGFWDAKFEPVKASELIALGFSGKELGEELRRRSLKIIKERFAK